MHIKGCFNKKYFKKLFLLNAIENIFSYEIRKIKIIKNKFYFIFYHIAYKS